ncbi:hypothetical protein AVEN_21989-1 [Araneus ventricosus]|uniref:Uncharacterized protein n=1 Tax=Araneus ventricosus TaxID=182803 RepID=A0A4Y2JCC7_ARAVE|nr:hypothetical protein AVEN_21989-1 [Araneus ventricosus]
MSNLWQACCKLKLLCGIFVWKRLMEYILWVFARLRAEERSKWRIILFLRSAEKEKDIIVDMPRRRTILFLKSAETGNDVIPEICRDGERDFS